MNAINATQESIDVREPHDVADAIAMLTATLEWLDNNNHPFAAIDVNDAIERLKSAQAH